MALRGRCKAEQEVALLKGAMEQMQGEMQELERMVLAGQGRREATPNVDSPVEHGSNPTPNRMTEDGDGNSEADEESYPEVSNLPDGHEGGKQVILLFLFGPYTVPVAKATIQTTNPKAKMRGTALGHECYEVVVNSVMKKDALLLRPYGNLKTMADAFGQSIAWPQQKMMNDEKSARPSLANVLVSGGS